jgi:hypothetical protein
MRRVQKLCVAGGETGRQKGGTTIEGKMKIIESIIMYIV